MYEIYNNILCVSKHALVISNQNPKGLLTYENYKAKCKRGKLTVVRPGKGKGNYALIEYQFMPPELKQKLIEVHGTPDIQASAKPFLDNIITDEKAKDYYKTYPYKEGETLPVRLQNEYTANASVLNAIKEVYENAIKARAKAGQSLKNFWKQAAPAINSIRGTANHNLPRNHRSLERLYKEYIESGYETLINGRLGNKNSEKITGDVLNWLTTEMANSRQSIDMVAMRYPAIAQHNNWDVNITPQAFRKRVSQPDIQQMIMLKRHGRKGFRKLYGHTFKLKKALYSNDLWVSDGTALSWYYKSPVYGKTGKLLHFEPKMATTYVVMDSSSNKILGYSTKEGINKENFEMQLEAYRAALRVAGAKPYQLLFDNQGGHKNTESRTFYSKLARVYFPTRAYRPSGKDVERLFKNFQTLKLSEFPFWSGFGRPSHSNLNYAPNMEDIRKNIDDVPTFDELVKLFDVTVAEWNELNFNGKGSPNDLYTENRNPEEQPIKVEDLAELFWNMQGPKKYNPWGINLIFKGEEVTYEVYDEEGNVDYNFRRKYLKQKFYLKYDPDGEYPEIELYQKHATGGEQRIATAHKKREASRSVKYFSEGDKAWIEKQMALESEMLDEMDERMAAIGYSDEVKWNNWRNKIEETDTTENNTVSLFGESDEGSMEVID